MTNLTRLQELDRQGTTDTPEARELALTVYEKELPTHQCYWNDRLYIAIRFGLDKERQRRAVVNSVVTNGRTGYFEQRTHFDFNNRSLLECLGVPVTLLPQFSDTPLDYQNLDEEVIRRVAKKFEIDLDNTSELRRLQGDFYHSHGAGF
jgi:hypothetical protein